MNEQITDRGTQKRLHTKFHTMNIMRSGTLLIKYSISSNIRQARCGHALSIHESRHSPLIAKKNFVDANLKIKIQKYKIIKNYL